MLLVHHCLKICLIHSLSLKQNRHTFGDKSKSHSKLIFATIIIFSNKITSDTK